MDDNKTNTQRVARNTLVLYMRMLLTVGISFYISRVVLANLGVSDYGLYNVIGGMVSMLYVVSGTLSNAISRFLTIELGRNKIKILTDVFITSVNILVIASIIVLLLGETIGLWFINTKLNINPARMEAANWIYQFSIASFILEMLCIPFYSLIIAHERMKAFAFMTIFEVLLKLGISLLLSYSPIDRLVFYGILMMLVAFLRNCIHFLYCKRQFVECSYHFSMNKIMFKNIFNFTSWQFLSVTSMLLSTNGTNIILNIFHGTVLNATQGVATQIKNAAGAFSKNFMLALNPQIIKSVAQKDDKTTVNLVYRGAKFSYLLFFCISLPILLECDYLLAIWLKEIPPYATVFVRFTLMAQLIEVLFQTTINLNNAIGEIKKFQIVFSCINILNLPFSYFLLRIGFKPYIVTIVYMFLNAILFFPCFIINKKYIAISIQSLFEKVLLKIIIVSLCSLAVSLPIHLFMQTSFLRLVLVILSAMIGFLISSYYVGLESNERLFIINAIKRKIFRL